MEPEHLRFGGGVAQTVLNPLVLLVVIIAGVLIVLSPRKRSLAVFVAASILIPIDQVLVIAGMHFPMLRVLIFFGIVRLLREKMFLRHQIFSGGINKIDLTLVLFTIFTGIAGVLLFRESGALVFQLGTIYTVFGVYFLLRFLLRSREEVVAMVRTLAYIAVVIAVVMTWEIVTGHNPYAMLGGARSSFYAQLMERDDRFRALGCFGHPILAGTFGATMVPLFVLLWREGRKHRTLAIAGIVAATVITLTSNSSTPVMAYAAGIIALLMWPLRNSMRMIRWGVLITIVGLHIVMKAPVWHLISRIDISGGSSSYHRYMLIDQCIRHFSDWWLIGVKSTSDWGWDMWDTANQYVSVCDSSGLLPFLLFLAIIVYGFKYLGKARRIASDRKTKLFMWALGSALFAHVVAFIGISYWDQTQVLWYGLLAAISAAVVMRPESRVGNKVRSKTLSWADPASELAVGSESDIFEVDSSGHPASQHFPAF